MTPDQDLIDVLEADLAYWQTHLEDALQDGNPLLREEALDQIDSIKADLRQLYAATAAKRPTPANRVRVVTRRTT